MGGETPTTRSDERRKTPLVVRLLAAIALGVLVGLALGPRAAPLGDVGLLAIKLLKALATPLMFFAVVDSFCRAQIPPKKGVILLGACLVNAAVAGALAIGLSGLLAPGARVERAVFAAAQEAPAGAGPRIDALSALRDLVPESVAEPFAKNQVLTVVFLAIITGAALRSLRARGSGETIFKLVEEAFALLTTVLQFIIALVPIAVFAVIAKVVGETGFRVLASLGALVGTVTLGLALHVFGYYALVLFAVCRRSPLAFFRASANALLTALGTGSSIATLPVTLRTLERDLGVGHDSARLAACVGTNFNNDGIMLYEVVAALFVAQVNGIALTLGQKAQLAITSALAAAGMAGVPEAGLITLSLVLGSVGLPLASLPVLLTVDWFLGRLRAATNVTSDLLIASLLDRLGGKSTPAE